MKILSLFDGISCARVALERAGIPVEVYYASEVDKYAMQISAKNYPDIIQVGDIKWFFPYSFMIGNIDLLIGGFPCQDLSIAKKNRQGLNGERSGLFYEMIRIHKEVKPKWFIYENVASMSRENKEIILKTIQEIDKSAYVIEINGALVSAQNRRRLFFTNIPNIIQPIDKGILLRDILEPKSNTIRTSDRGSGVDDKHNWDTIRIGQIGKGGQGDRIYSDSGKSVSLSANGGGRGAKTRLYCISSKQKHATISENKSSPLVSAMGMGGGHIPMITEDFIEIRKLSPIECERLTTLPDNYTKYGINEKGEEILISNSQRYKMCGNAFVCDVVAHILKFIK